ncbi:nicotinate-nucleotide diphosphorylase (carboxylating) [Rhodobacteraceae bacterium WD3A24]|nr:nicotinate-nucleotide diphosphorylase (carboxylating) [Rhodobacteraceae bacterium WD3A24]
MPQSGLPDLIVEPVVRAALAEDLGSQGDITGRAVIPPGTRTRAQLAAREGGVVSGLAVAALAFRLVDPALRVVPRSADGAACTPGEVLMTVDGDAAAILAGERVALNFAARLSGIATATAALVAETAGTAARITCTRKTTPGLRALEKRAVLDGGGFNHRFSLSDAILIKDNHIAAAGGIGAVLSAARAAASHMVRIEIEVDRLDQIEEVLAAGGADAVLLDNMETATLRAAVGMIAGRLVTEASGGMTPGRVREVAATGVDYISSGAITHSAPALDLGLDV